MEFWFPTAQVHVSSHLISGSQPHKFWFQTPQVLAPNQNFVAPNHASSGTNFNIFSFKQHNFWLHSCPWSLSPLGDFTGWPPGRSSSWPQPWPGTQEKRKAGRSGSFSSDCQCYLWREMLQIWAIMLPALETPLQRKLYPPLPRDESL